MAEKKRILCYGDSLTWGFDPVSMVRFPAESRWPMVLQEILDDDYQVIEEGQCGRTIAMEDPSEGEKNGLTYLLPCLESHTPLELLIIMLGSNDCKSKFALSGMDVAGEMQIFLRKAIAYNHFCCEDAFQILLIAPPLISKAVNDSWLGENFGFDYAVELSTKLAGWYQELANRYHVHFLDASQYVKASDADGCHLDAEGQMTLGRAIAAYVQEKILTEKEG